MCKNVVERIRNDAFQIRIILDTLKRKFIFETERSRVLHTLHSKRFAGSCLSVGKYCAVEAIQN